jgi:hypothetical protein
LLSGDEVWNGSGDGECGKGIEWIGSGREVGAVCMIVEVANGADGRPP